MPARFQLVVDCAEPEPLARFRAAALGYELERPPEGFAAVARWPAWTAAGVHSTRPSPPKRGTATIRAGPEAVHHTPSRRC